MSAWLLTRLLLDCETAVEKNVQGASPANANSGYGGPSLFTPASRWKINVKINIAISGCNTAHSPPSSVCRYRILMSRHTRKASNSRYRKISLKSTGCHPVRGRIVTSNGPQARAAYIQARSDEALGDRPTRSLLAESRPSLPGVLFEGIQLGAMQCGIHLRGPARIHFIQAFGDRIPLLPVQELRNRGSVQLTSRNPEAAGSSFRQTEKVVGYRDGGLHAHSITRVIPDPLRPTVSAAQSPGRTE